MKRIIYSLLLALPFPAVAQIDLVPPALSYPQDYFRNPLDIPIFLAGNFGECRPGHFHSGIDIKTLGKENQPVYAAADGYIARIKMEKGGFGHAIYIVHPNGYTTLYAHLNKFIPQVQDYVRQEQYKRKRWDVDLDLQPGQFPVTKGTQIAWSGNTGASTAPHLHFEIRSTKNDHPLNPELFGFTLVDTIPPVPAEVVIYYDGNVYRGGKATISLVKKDNVYKPNRADAKACSVSNDTITIPYSQAIRNSRGTGIGINADDFMNGSESTLAFYKAKLYMDGKLQEEITLDNIGYEETRYLNAYADYKVKAQTGKWVQCLFQLPGNRLNTIFSNQNNKKGILDLSDGEAHKINIQLIDDKGNESSVLFYLKAEEEDIDSLGRICCSFGAGRENRFDDPHVSFSLDERQLYDDICFRFSSAAANKALSDKYSLCDPNIPLHHYFELKIKPTLPVPVKLKNKVVMVYSDGKDEDGRAAVAIAGGTDDGWYKAKVRNFGAYWLDVDTIPPVIKPLQKNHAKLSKAERITFEVKDAMTSVKSFSGYLDGKWICFEAHANSYFYEFDERCPPGKHELVFKAEDENGNAAMYKLSFLR